MTDTSLTYAPDSGLAFRDKLFVMASLSDAPVQIPAAQARALVAASRRADRLEDKLIEARVELAMQKQRQMVERWVTRGAWVLIVCAVLAIRGGAG